MTRLYTAFANGGAVKPLVWQPQTSVKAGDPLISPESAFLVTNILTQITRPDLPNNFDNSYHLPRIAWKTGTSYGRRDAWSIGYNRRFTVGVWVGNFSGIGVPELSGANTATPLLFQIFNAIDYNSTKGWFKAPKGNLALRQVCPESGDVPNEFCQGRAVDYYIMGVSRAQRCQHLKPVFTNPAGTLSYCVHCLPEQRDSVPTYIKRNYPNLTPELIAHYENRHIPYDRIPPHNPGCERVFGAGQNQASAPLITSPNDGSDYFVDSAHPADMQLACQAANDVQTVYWYLNDKLYKRAKPTEPVFFTPHPGVWAISCADDRGRSSTIKVIVKSQ